MLVQDKPEGLPSSNALDYIEDPDERPTGERAEIYLSGALVCTLDNAPSGLERITLMVELEVLEEGHKFKENGQVEVPVRRCRRVGDMWRPGTERPPTKEEVQAEQAAEKARIAREKADQDEAERAEREHNEPPMFDEDGDPIAIDAPAASDGDGVVDAEVIEDDDEDDSDNVVQFSDTSKT